MPGYKVVGYDPPAPVANVSVRNPVTSTTINHIEMLLDSGADVTLIPQDAVTGLSIPMNTDESYAIMGYDGTIQHASVVELEMIFYGKLIEGVTRSQKGIQGLSGGMY